MTPTISLRRGSLLSGGNKCIVRELVYLARIRALVQYPLTTEGALPWVMS